MRAWSRGDGRNGGVVVSLGAITPGTSRWPRASLYPHVLGLLVPLVVEPVLGAPYLRTADFLRDFWAWPPERRKDHQHHRLQAVLDSAAREVPFYRQILPRSGPVEDRLADLPIVDKVLLRKRPADFLSDRCDGMPTLTKRTGGTLTGTPWEFRLDTRAWVQIYAASLHFYERTGFRYGERQVLLGRAASLGHDGRSVASRLRSAVERKTTAFAGPELDLEHSRQRALRACDRRAALWYGYASTIAAMADAVLDTGLQVRGPRTIVTTAEALRPEWRRRIESAFGAQVYDQYGCNDGGILAQTCQAGRFHIAENVSLVEVVEDGRSCPPGVEGDVVVTNLHAQAMPFLRYAVGDRATLGDGDCPCGTPGRTLQRVLGRQNERIVLPSGVQVTGLGQFSAVFTSVPGVLRWQVAQTSVDALTVRLDVGRSYDLASQAVLERRISELCRGEVRVRVTTEEPVTATAGGKHLTVVP